MKIPEQFEYLFTLFWEIRKGSTEGMGGIRITWADIEAFKNSTGIELNAFEVEAIIEMDASFLDERDKRLKNA